MEEFSLISQEPEEYSFSRVHFKCESEHWATPERLYKALNAEFSFTLDPCPLRGADGLTRSWTGERVYCNPPYGAGIEMWLRKGAEAEIAVYLLPVRTDVEWFHAFAGRASEVRFIRGRLHFNDSPNAAPFPSMLMIFSVGPVRG